MIIKIVYCDRQTLPNRSENKTKRRVVRFADICLSKILLHLEIGKVIRKGKKTRALDESEKSCEQGQSIQKKETKQKLIFYTKEQEKL